MHILFCFLMPFLFLNTKMHALAVSYLQVTLQMVSNNRRSFFFNGSVQVQFILQEACYSPDEELEHDVTS
jgi:hypothetical protein